MNKEIRKLMIKNNIPESIMTLYGLEIERITEEYHSKQLLLHNVSKSLPTKNYEIDFGGDVLAGLEITNNEPKIIGAMNGWGNGISKDKITITEK